MQLWDERAREFHEFLGVECGSRSARTRAESAAISLKRMSEEGMEMMEYDVLIKG